VYYYSRAYKLQRGMVVEASELRETSINPCTSDTARGNVILYAGYRQVLDTAAMFKAPKTNFVGIKGPYSKALLEKILEAVLRHFPNHPPIDFAGVKEGDPILFSYFFQQAMMPRGFFWLREPQPLGEVKVRSLLYRQDRDTAAGSKVKLVTGPGYRGVRAALENKSSAVYILEGAEEYYRQIASTGVVPQDTGTWQIGRNEALWLPDIDMFIGKTYTEAEKQRKGLSAYKVVDERIKVKTTVKGSDPVHFYGKLWRYNQPVLFYLEDNATGKPYYTLLIRNPEILVKLKR
jgi:hypothetical protein